MWSYRLKFCHLSFYILLVISLIVLLLRVTLFLYRTSQCIIILLISTLYFNSVLMTSLFSHCTSTVCCLLPDYFISFPYILGLFISVMHFNKSAQANLVWHKKISQQIRITVDTRNVTHIS